MKVKVDRELCSGIGNCVAIDPTVFELDDQNKAVVLDRDSVNEETLMEAAESCPVNAIIIEDNEGNQLYLWAREAITGRYRHKKDLLEYHIIVRRREHGKHWRH